MFTHFYEPSPGDPPGLFERLHQIHVFWEQLNVGGDPGETTWGELESIEGQCIAALKKVPMDVTLAESLTAYAALRMTGLVDL